MQNILNKTKQFSCTDTIIFFNSVFIVVFIFVLNLNRVLNTLNSSGILKHLRKKNILRDFSTYFLHMSIVLEINNTIYRLDCYMCRQLFGIEYRMRNLVFHLHPCLNENISSYNNNI